VLTVQAVCTFVSEYHEYHDSTILVSLSISLNEHTNWLLWSVSSVWANIMTKSSQHFQNVTETLDTGFFGVILCLKSWADYYIQFFYADNDWELIKPSWETWQLNCTAMHGWRWWSDCFVNDTQKVITIPILAMLVLGLPVLDLLVFCRNKWVTLESWVFLCKLIDILSLCVDNSGYSACAEYNRNWLDSAVQPGAQNRLGVCVTSSHRIVLLYVRLSFRTFSSEMRNCGCSDHPHVWGTATP